MLFFWIKLKFDSINLNPLDISFLNLYNFRCNLLHGLDPTCCHVSWSEKYESNCSEFELISAFFLVFTTFESANNLHFVVQHSR